MINLLIVDDEKSVLNVMKFAFEDKYNVLLANNIYEVNKILVNNKPTVSLIDLRFGKISGLEVVKKIKYMYPDSIIIVMTAYGTIETSIKAIKIGAYDYIQKPIDIDKTNELIENAINHFELKKKILIDDNESRRLVKIDAVRSIVTKSKKMEDILKIVKKVSNLNVNILIQGESGTGKELIVRAIHQMSNKKEYPFEVINCGAISENLIESELFGHVKGAFTGATDNKKGVFERANNGMLFLDEIGEMNLVAQVKLLRVLQEREILPVGGEKAIKVDVRVIAATNKNLEQEVENGTFRKDLFYRLNVMSINLPSLKDRKEDIPVLVDYFIKRANETYGTTIEGINKGALSKLMKYNYKGNVRELENIVCRAVIMANEGLIDENVLPDLNSNNYVYYDDDIIPIQVGAKLADVERETIIRTLESVNGNKSKAARILGISERSIHYKTKKIEEEE